tara:strand:- start:2274 stop:5963 length:3690 start_codon:yes stop_codon:yes gene_type:complete
LSQNFKVPLGDGMSTSVNPTKINIVEVKNLYTDIEDGSYIKRTGMGGDASQTTDYWFSHTSKLFKEFIYWINPKTEIFNWLGWDYTSKSLYKYKALTNDSKYPSNEKQIFTLGVEQVVNQLVGTSNNMSISQQSWAKNLSATYYFKVTTVPNYPTANGWTQPTQMVYNQNSGSSNQTLTINANSWTGSDGTQYEVEITAEGPTNTADVFKLTKTLEDGTQTESTDLVFVGGASTMTDANFDGITLNVLPTNTGTVGAKWNVVMYKNHRISISTDDVEYTNSIPMSESLVELDGTDGLKGSFNDKDQTTTALDDKWSIQINPYSEITNLINWGQQLRIALGPSYKPRVYQQIDRGFFWLGSSFAVTYKDDHLDNIPFPRTSPTWYYESATVSSGGELTDDVNYYYKFTPVFDGDQEGLLEEDYAIASTTAVNKTVTLKFQINTTNLNPRTTGLKLYRASRGSGTPVNAEYKFIKGYNISEDVSDVFSLSTTDAYVGEKIMFQGDWNTKYLFRDVNTGIWGNSVEFLDYNDTTAFTNTFICPKDSANEAGFVYLNTGNPTDLDSWGTTGNVWLYDTQGQQVVNPEMDSHTHWTDPNGSNGGVYTWGNFGGFTDGNATIIHCYYDKIVSANQWVEITTSVNAIVMGSNANIFYCEWEHAKNTTGSNNQSINYTRVRIDIYRESVLIATEYSDAVSLSNNTPTSFARPQKTVKFENISLLSTDSYKVTFEAKSTSSGSGEITIGVAYAGIRKGYTNQDASDQYRHKTAIGVVNADLSPNQLQGANVTVNDGSGAVEFTCDSHPINDMSKVPTITSNGNANTGWLGTNSDTGNTVSISNTTYEDLGSGAVRINFIDTGELDGAYHQNASDSSLDTRYTYSEPLNGRNFVADIKIVNNLGVEEYYNDMVMFSEVGQPDVIPITNFIKLNDLQGGKIYGLSSILSDLIVFAERGIFRVSVPTTDPTGWSVVEAEPNLGCVEPRTIKKWNNGVFFAGIDGFYYVDINFGFNNLTKNLKTEYKSLSSLGGPYDTFSHIDNNNNRLHFCNNNADNTSQVFYTLSLEGLKQNKIVWTSNFLGSTSQKEGTSLRGMFDDNDLKTYVSVKGDTQANSYIKFLEGERRFDQSNITGNNGSPIKHTLETGWIQLSKLGKRDSVTIRRIHIDALTTEAFVIKLKIDQSDVQPTELSFSIPSQSASANPIRSIRIGKRARRVQISILTTVETYDLFRIRSLEMEVG